MSACIALRTDYTADQLRQLARGSRNAKQVRRLLAMADILEGWSRGEVARRASVSIQTIRDWVIHFNDEGPEGLIDRKSTGRPPKLTPAQQETVKDILQEGPDPKVDGVVRWRCKDIVKVIKDKFSVDLDERNVGRLFRRQGFSYISARTQHPKQKPEQIEEFKKNSPTIWQKLNTVCLVART